MGISATLYFTLQYFMFYPIEKIDRMYTIKLEVHILFPLLNYAENFLWPSSTF